MDRRIMLADGLPAESVGDLTYLISLALIDGSTVYADVKRHVDDYISLNGVSYTTLNGVVGSCMCAGIEHMRRTSTASVPLETYLKDFYREVVAPYEDIKIRENGDIYP